MSFSISLKRYGGNVANVDRNREAEVGLSLNRKLPRTHILTEDRNQGHLSLKSLETRNFSNVGPRVSDKHIFDENELGLQDLQDLRYAGNMICSSD